LKVQYSKLLLFSISLFLVFEGLDAYSLNNIPIYWLGVSFLLLVFIGLHFLGFKASSFNFVSVRNWVFYGISITLIQSIFNDIVLPKYASTTYVQYISLRLLRLLFFLVVIYCIDYILKKYSFEYILSFFLVASLLISTLSLISYFSYIYGYSDFPRTRPGSGGWTQPIERACNILRNYGTFREPSFLAIWTVPFLPYFFYMGKTKKIWYVLSVIPILSIVLSRSLTGVIAFLLASSIVLLIIILIHRKVELNLVALIGMFIFVIFTSSVFSFQFPPDENYCSGLGNDCVCYTEDKLDELKSSTNISEATFGRFQEIASQGLDAFSNTAFLLEYIQNQGFSVFGDGYGYSNITFSYAADEATKKLQDNQIIYRNPGQVVSFNNLYANILMSTGLVGLLWFLYILIDVFRRLVFRNVPIQPYVLISFISILFIYSYQAEEIAAHLAIAIAFALNLQKNEK
jgi:hypothetical protein|tara:strand:- start:305 stop:1681 length:1377 start_codon:yes stop_codon:yes gene_type:complete